MKGIKAELIATLADMRAKGKLLEAQRLVQTWVPHCEALEPPELRTAVAQALKQGAKGHLPTVSRREAKT